MRMNEIWLEVTDKEKSFELFYDQRKRRHLKLRGDEYIFEDIVSYRNYKTGVVRIKLSKAEKIK